MDRDDVCRLELDYAGELADLASHLLMVGPIYDQESDGGVIEEYIYGEVSGERVEAIRVLGEHGTALIRLGPPQFFSAACLRHLLRSLTDFDVRVTSYWTRESLTMGVALPYVV